jgi:FdhD protein
VSRSFSTTSRRLREHQSIFRRRRAPAAALFETDGSIREIAGHRPAQRDRQARRASFCQELPLSTQFSWFRADRFEIVQKAARRRGADRRWSPHPSLAVELAQTGGLTLVGFLRERRFNVYADPIGPLLINRGGTKPDKT